MSSADSSSLKDGIFLLLVCCVYISVPSCGHTDNNVEVQIWRSCWSGMWYTLSYTITWITAIKTKLQSVTKSDDGECLHHVADTSVI
jgi:hypothetical protein